MSQDLSSEQWRVTPSSILFAVIFASIFIFGLFSNLLILIVFVIKRNFRHLTSLFFVNLSIADIMVLLFCMPVAIADLFSPDVWYLGALICRLYTFLEYLATSVSSFTVIAISIERFVAITRPFQVRSLFSKKNSAVVLFLIWFVGVIVSIPFLFISEHHSTPVSQCVLNLTSNDMIYVHVLYAMLIFIPIIGLSIIYIYIIYKLRTYNKASELDNNEHVTNASVRFSNNLENSSLVSSLRLPPRANSRISFEEKKRRRFKNAIMVTLIGWAFFCCQLPLRTFLLWSYSTHHASPTYLSIMNESSSSTASVVTAADNHRAIDLLSNIASTFYFLHCVSNSIIYNIMSTKFRRAFFDISIFN